MAETREYHRNVAWTQDSWHSKNDAKANNSLFCQSGKDIGQKGFGKQNLAPTVPKTVHANDLSLEMRTLTLFVNLAGDSQLFNAKDHISC